MNGSLLHDLNADQFYLLLEEGTVYRNLDRFRVVMMSEDFLAVKIPGGMAFGGQGMPQQYDPAQYVIFEHGDRHLAPEFRQNLWCSVLSFDVRQS